MFDVLSQVSWLGVFAATLAFTVFGALWFAVVFARPYALALGKADAPREPPSPRFIVGPLVCNLVTVVTSALLMRALHVQSLGDAVGLGLVVGCGYLVSTMTNTAINPNMPRPFLYSLISGPHFLVGSVLVSVVLWAVG